MNKLYRIPSFWQVIQAVGRVTFWEIVRDKVLYNVGLAGLIIFSVSFLASRLNAIQPERVTVDFGMSALSLSCLLIAVLTGAGMLAKEFDRRTAYVVLSHPITRFQFVAGKYFGLITVVTLNWFLLTLLYIGMLATQAEDLSVWVFNPTWIAAVVLTLLQGLFMASITVLFSTFTTTSLTVIMTFGLYLIGSNNTEIRNVALKMDSAAGRALLEGVAAILPNLEHFNLGYKATYALPVTPLWFAGSLAYGILYTALCLLGAGLLIRGRES